MRRLLAASLAASPWRPPLRCTCRTRCPSRQRSDPALAAVLADPRRDDDDRARDQ